MSLQVSFPGSHEVRYSPTSSSGLRHKQTSFQGISQLNNLNAVDTIHIKQIHKTNKINAQTNTFGVHKVIIISFIAGLGVFAIVSALTPLIPVAAVV